VCPVTAIGLSGLAAKRAAKRQWERDTARAAKYAEAISNGQMTLQEALVKIGEEEREAKDKEERDNTARQRFSVLNFSFSLAIVLHGRR
jgi:hypothetical protein